MTALSSGCDGNGNLVTLVMPRSYKEYTFVKLSITMDGHDSHLQHKTLH